MNIPYKTMELTFTRRIPASPAEVYDAWLDTENPGNPWHAARTLVFNPRQGELFYFVHEKESGEKAHYGRFVELDRPNKVKLTWMSVFTRGLESIITTTFESQGEDTLLTLTHSNLPDDEFGAAHQGGWDHFLGLLVEHFTGSPA